MNIEKPCAYCQSLVVRTPSEFKKSKTGNIFCCQSCAAFYNNKHFIKRIAKNNCKKCGTKIRSNAKYCGQCYKLHHYLDDKTLLEVILNKKNDANRYTTIRGRARRVYFDSGGAQCCAVCGYTQHIEICHIQDISKFPSNTLVRTINDITNLIAFCPTHHWEFDHGLITISDGKIVSSRTSRS